MKKLIKVLPLALILAAGSAMAEIPKNIKIGTDPTYAPFESKNASGELVGFDIDLAKELCKRIQANCTFVESDFDALIPSLKAKKLMPSSLLCLSPKNASRKLLSPRSCMRPIHA